MLKKLPDNPEDYGKPIPFSELPPYDQAEWEYRHERYLRQSGRRKSLHGFAWFVALCFIFALGCVLTVVLLSAGPLGWIAAFFILPPIVLWFAKVAES